MPSRAGLVRRGIGLGRHGDRDLLGQLILDGDDDTRRPAAPTDRITPRRGGDERLHARREGLLLVPGQMLADREGHIAGARDGIHPARRLVARPIPAIADPVELHLAILPDAQTGQDVRRDDTILALIHLVVTLPVQRRHLDMDSPRLGRAARSAKVRPGGAETRFVFGKGGSPHRQDRRTQRPAYHPHHRRPR